MAPDYDEKDWGLEIDRCDDGDILLRQGDCSCGCGANIIVRLHPAYAPAPARHHSRQVPAPPVLPCEGDPGLG